MNIALISTTASFHHLASRLEMDPMVKNIYHFGASHRLVGNGIYHPIDCDIPDSGLWNTTEISEFIVNLSLKKIDLVLASNLPLMQNYRIRNELEKNKIACLFAQPSCLESYQDIKFINRFFKKTDIPTVDGLFTTGRDLFENFLRYPRPFVLKVKDGLHGLKTYIVDDENCREIYDTLFSIFINFKPKISNIGLDTDILIERFVNLKCEYSYIALINRYGWKHLGCAKNYKRELDNDKGRLCNSMGAINFTDTDHRVHGYMEKIYVGLMTDKDTSHLNYNGFITLKIGILDNDTPIVLGINMAAREPDINVVIETIENCFSELFLAGVHNQKIPDIVHNDSKISCVRVANKNNNWFNQTYYIPRFNENGDVRYYYDKNTSYQPYYSMLIGKGDSHRQASEKIYKSLKSQELRGFYYRTDIGMY